jgi:hypothetical protein
MSFAHLSNEGQWYDDLASNLDTFARLSKAGHFDRADHFYRRALRRYCGDFPIAAQYADSLIDQAAFGMAEDFLVQYEARQVVDGTKAATEAEVLTVLRLLLANAQLYTKFEPGKAAKVAVSAIQEVGVITIDEAMPQLKVHELRVSASISLIH